MAIKKVWDVNGYRKSAICSCDHCGKEFRRSFIHAERRGNHFCGNKCRSIFRGTPEGYKIYHKASSEAKMGSKNPMFGKKITPENKRRLAIAIFKKMKNKSNYKYSADLLWGRIIKSKGKCEVCGETKYLNPHHIIGRRVLILRHDLQNGVCLCSGCHIMRTKSAHQDPLWFYEWVKEHYPERIEYLNKQKNVIKKMTVEDYEKLVEELRAKDTFYER